MPGLLGLAVLTGPDGQLLKLVPETQAGMPGAHTYKRGAAADAGARYCGPGLLGLGITALIAGFMSGDGRKR